MKKLKRNKAYGAFEYTVIISLVIVVALIFLNIVKGRAGESISTLDKATSAAENALNFSPGGGTGGGAVSSISVDFSGPFNYDFEDEIEVAVQDYFTNHATVRKSGEVASYNLSGIVRVGNYIQVDIEADGEIERKQFAFNNLCLATDDDFELEEDTFEPELYVWRYRGISNCVEIPQTMNGEEITSYRDMFRETSVERVISTNTNVVDMHGMFGWSQATSLDLSRFDTSNVADMGWMFAGSQTTSLDLSSFNTLNVAYMNMMFGDSQIIDINFGTEFNTENVLNMAGMFFNYKSSTLDLLDFNTSKVENMNAMFRFSQIEFLDLSNFDFSNITKNVLDEFNVLNMFEGSSTTSVLVKDAASQTKLNGSSNKPAHTIISIK